MKDDELAEKIVRDQVSIILLMDRFRDSPLAMSPLPAEEKARKDAEWQKAIRLGLNEEISIEVDRRVKAARGKREKPWEIQIIPKKEYLRILRKMYDKYYGREVW